MNTTSGLLIAVLLATAVLSTTFARPASDAAFDVDQLTTTTKGKGNTNKKGNNGGGNNGGGVGGFFGPGGGFGVPGFGNGWGNGVGGGPGGYGGGYGGPSGGYSKGGIVRPTVVCKEKGPCYKKKLTCPAKCFSSYSRSGKNFGGGGGGGGCTMDCKKKCIAYC